MESETNDRQFFDRFLLVLGGLAAFAVVVYFIAGVIASGTQHVWQLEDPDIAQRASERIEPVGTVVIAGQAEPESVMETVEPVAQAPKSGEEIYNGGCHVCHTAGIAGAPRLGDAEGWAPRIAQGLDVLRDHAVNGYVGAAGAMPARGGMNISDEEVHAAVDYLLEQSAE